MEVSVFECGICCSDYNEETRIPLSLPCGHVFCKDCLTSYASGGATNCPIDKSVHHISKQRSANCIRHPRKRVKFLCRAHQNYLCSDCVIDHTGSGHELTVFTVTREQMRQNMESLVDSSAQVINDIKNALQKYQQEEKQIVSFYEAQVLNVNTAFENAIRILNNKKKELLDILRKRMKEQQVQCEVKRIKHSKRFDAAMEWANELKIFADSIDTHFYEEFAEFMGNKRDELDALGGESGTYESEYKYYVFNDTVNISDMGNITLLKPMDVEKSSRVEDEEQWKCSNCAFTNIKTAYWCMYCKQSKTPDFSLSQGTDTTRSGLSPRGAKASTLNVDLELKPNVVKKTQVNKVKVIPRTKFHAKKRVMQPKRNNSF